MKLKKLIINFHWIVWIVSVVYSLWKFRKSSEKHFFSLNYSDFEDGWIIINRPKDNSDFEWTVLTSTFKKYWLLLFFQILTSEIFRRTLRTALPFFYACYSIFSLTVIIGDKATLILMGYIVIMFSIHTFGRKLYCYVLTICALMLKNSSFVFETLSEIHNGDIETFLFDVALTWIMAKSLSFMLDRINQNIHHRVTLIDFSEIVAYCLYLPSVFTGPILTYEAFVKQMCTTYCSSTFSDFISKIKHYIYILFWYFIYEIMLHFIYSSSIQYYPDVALDFDSWSLCGLGYALPLMFFLKYYIIYGMTQSIARFENFEFPPPPKCVTCIHLSSFLWRHFDRGLYIWILKYLYHPLMQGKCSVGRKIVSQLFIFAFICLWHNADKAVCVWTFLNFILVSSEMLLQPLLSPELIKRNFPAISYHKKVAAVCAAPHFIMMCISSTFFLSNYEIGILLFKRVLFTGVLPLVPILFIMFCGCAVSLDVRHWEKNRCSAVSWKSFWS